MTAACVQGRAVLRAGYALTGILEVELARLDREEPDWQLALGGNTLRECFPAAAGQRHWATPLRANAAVVEQRLGRQRGYSVRGDGRGAEAPAQETGRDL